MEDIIPIVHKRFDIVSLKEFQRNTLAALLIGRDVFLSSKTGGGKSLCFQAFPDAWKHKNGTDAIVLVVCPLISIMKEQVEFLNNLGFKACYIGQNGILEEVLTAGEYTFVFSSPESVVGTQKWRDMLVTESYQRRLKLVAIDESHTILLWGEKRGSGEAFRSWFSCLGELRSLAPQAPMLVMTATASNSARFKIKRKLAMRDPLEIVESPDRSNIKLLLKRNEAKLPLDCVFAWLIELLEDAGQRCPRYVVFCKTIKDCSKVYTTFAMNITKREIYQMYHSMTDESVKEAIRSDMSNPNGAIRVLICTNAAGMGVNFSGVNNIVNFGPPHDMDTFLQQFGRAGRTGDQSYAILMFTNRQLRNIDNEMLNYIRNEDQCRRIIILQHYNNAPSGIIGHLCCDICTKKCQCETNCDSQVHPAFDNYEDDYPEDLASIVPLSTEEEENVKALLLSYKESLDAGAHMIPGECLHGFTQKTIASIIKLGHSVTSADILMEKCNIWSFAQAMDVMKIIACATDLPTHEELLEYMGEDDDV